MSGIFLGTVAMAGYRPGSGIADVGHMRLYSNMIKLIIFHKDRKYCGRSHVIADIITDHHISPNSLM